MVHGADVSSWQDDATVAAIEHEHLGFAFVKLTQAVGYVDASSARRVALLHAHGLAVGVYHYLTAAPPNTAQPAWGATQWQHFEAALATLPLAGRLLVCVDYEAAGTTDELARGFIAAGRKAGYLVGCYSSADTHGYADLGQAWRWVAAWGKAPPRRPWAFWQFAAAPAHDWDLYNGSAASLARFWGRYAGHGGYRVTFTGTPAHTAYYRSQARAALAAIAYAAAHPRRRGYTIARVAP